MNNMLETKRQVTRKPESAEWLSYCRPAFCPQLTSPDENTVYTKGACEASDHEGSAGILRDFRN